MSKLSACREVFENENRGRDLRRDGDGYVSVVHLDWVYWQKVWNAALDQAAKACEGKKRLATARLGYDPDYRSACDDNIAAITALREVM